MENYIAEKNVVVVMALDEIRNMNYCNLYVVGNLKCDVCAQQVVLPFFSGSLSFCASVSGWQRIFLWCSSNDL